jgi:hypothetical protein
MKLGAHLPLIAFEEPPLASVVADSGDMRLMFITEDLRERDRILADIASA